MPPSDTDISLLRKMVADPAPGEYSNAELIAIVEEYPLGESYDLNAAARDVWELKAAGFVAAEERFTADGKSFDYGSLYDKAMKMRAFYSSKVNSIYAAQGYSYLGRDDVDPTGNGDYLTRSIL